MPKVISGYEGIQLARRRMRQINREVENVPVGASGLQKGFVRVSEEDARDAQAIDIIEENVMSGGSVRPQGFIKEGKMTVQLLDSEGEEKGYQTFAVSDLQDTSDIDWGDMYGSLMIRRL